jgi:flagellin FlaB
MIFKNNKRAEMGIGTLIIFIAMLLVAAVAAGVLIQTNSALQEKALSTGDQAKGQISTNVRIVEVSATDGSNGDVELFNQIIKLSPGSDAIKFEQALLTINTFNTTTTLTFCGNGCDIANNASGYQTDATAGNGTFVVEYLQRGSNPVAGNLQRGDVVRLHYAAPRSIAEDEQVRLNLIPKIGTPTLTEFITPEVISEQRVYLYP